MNKKVKPKKAALAESNEKVAKLESELSVKQAKLKEATDKVAALDKDLTATKNKKEGLIARHKEC